MKKIFIGIGAFFGVLLVALIGISLYVSTLLTEGFLVNQLESTLNLRADLEELNVGIFSGASITLRGVALHRRDGVANRGTPLEDRKPIKNPLVKADNVDVRFQLFPLLGGRLVVDKFVFRKPVVNLVIYSNGSNNLGPLFETPRVVNGQRNPALDQKPAPQPDPAAEGDGDFKAQDLPLAADLNNVGISDGDISVYVQSRRDTFKVQNLDLYLTSIDVDPADLENHNSAHLDLNSNVTVLGRNKEPKGVFNMTADSDITPFDKKTGKINPRLRVLLTMESGSYVNGFALMDELAGDLPVLRQAGVLMKGLEEKAVLSRDTDLEVEYSRGLVKLLNEPTFPTKNYSFGLRKGSTLRLSNSSHNFLGSVLATDEETRRVFENVDKELSQALKGTGANAVSVRNKALQNIIRDGKVSLDFRSLGALGDPNVKLLANLPGLTDVIRSAGGDILDAQLKKELDKIPGGEAAKKAVDTLKSLF